MTDIVLNFLAGFFGRTVGNVASTYVIRYIDKFMHKNNRHESK